MGITFYMTCLLALCCAHTCLGASSAVHDDHVDQLLEDTEREVRSWFAEKPHPIQTNNFTTRSYKKRASPEIHELGMRTAVLAYAADRLSKRFELSREEADVIVQARAAQRPGFNVNDICTRRVTGCDAVRNSRYRNIDGTCNNLVNTQWGMAITRFDRFIPANYSDGIGAFRRSVVKNEELLSPRIIRLIVHPDNSRLHNFVTHMVVGFGQFLDHDITSTPEGQNLDCCTNRNNPECMAILAPTNDDFYSQFGITCLDIARSVRACGGGQREQINQATAFIDGSQIYGNSVTETNNLRSFNNGTLLTDANNRLLPKDNNVQQCGVPQQGITCFRAGDDRLNENPGLTSMHTIWLREHNRIAQGLRNINPGWSDETLFQETKRIVIAELQNIVYTEFLPAIIGPNAMNIFGLNLPTGSATSTYDQNVAPIIYNEFAAAAYRFGHSFIQNNYQMPGNGGFDLENSFQNPGVLYQNLANIDRIMLGFSQQSAQNGDNFVVQAVTNHLFQRPGARFGTDLASLNIQRGRDHGLPPYNFYRGVCGMRRAASFDDLSQFFGSTETANRFRDSYRNVNDIDLWPAGISETPVANGAVGDTFACIIGDQFRRIFRGDRYFFTHGNQAGSFTQNQLGNLRQRTMASVMCDNASPTVTNLQRNVFLQSGTREPCSNLPKLNLNNWKA